MAVKNNKKGYAFSFFSLFLVIIIFFYAELQFGEDTFSSANNLEEYRIYSMNEEVIYFKDSYFLEVFDVATYKAMDILIRESSDPNIYNLYKNNYSQLNHLLKELITNSSLNSVYMSEMNNYTLSNLTDKIIENNQKNYFLNTSYTVKDLIIYERNPMILDIQAVVEFNFTSLDQVSSWKFNETILTRFQTYNLFDPSYYIIADLGVNSSRIEPVELFAANLNWSLELFNITLQNQFSTIYYDPDFKYTIGNSLLKNLFNISQGSYKDVFAFYSFDYDEEENQVYDTSQGFHKMELYGDSLVLLNLENYTSISDKSSYHHTIINSSGIKNSSSCVWRDCIYLNKSNSDFLRVQNDNHFENMSEFSTSLWFNFGDINANQSILSSGFNTPTSDAFEIILLENLSGIEVNFRCNSIFYSYSIFTKEISNQDNYLYLGINIKNGSSNMYINGISQEVFSFNPSTCSNISLKEDIFLGTNSDASDLFANGTIDEIGIYSSVFEQNQVGSAYISSRIFEVDYQDSLYGKGVYFNDNNYLNFSLNSTWEDFHQNNFSISLWFMPKTTNATLLTYETELSLGYNKTGIYISDNNGNTAFFDDLPVVQNRYNHLVIRKNSLGSEVFLNNNEASSVVGGLITPDFDQGKFTFGSSTVPTNGVVANNFEGILDEIVFYNRTLSNFEIQRQYYNFDSEAKGCCNYLIPFNPNLHGFNTSAYQINTSYSSHMFFNHVFRDQENNITLYTVKNITSSSTSNEYFNFLVDNCMARAYNIYGYFNDGSALTKYNEGDDELLSCSWLIKEGYY